ncbi:MAG TPA: hypothetical protein VKG44_05220 [Candidatus Baltobacteraceae bacterium]|nr:hypothetical protein [Candidatus Baltobacteraceae bacterium]
MSPEPDDAQKPDRISGTLGYWQKIGLAAAGVLTAVAQLWLAIQKQWQLTVVTLLLAAIVTALYYLFFRHWAAGDERKRQIARWSAIAVLIGIPVIAMLGVISYSYLPRLRESGNTIAVAQFGGPALPKPYENCRPSAILAHALADVSDRFHRITVFEVPYSIEPDRRWTDFWAQSHGWFDSADVIVYGDYDLAKSADKLINADQITINPRVNSVPKVPIADKVPPLYSWTLLRRTESIAQLCGTPITANDVPEFPDDARRLALAVVGADLFATQDYEGAQRALTEAKAQPRGGNGCNARTLRSRCGGVLAYYLANLDLQLGNFADAESEYLYAAGQLESSAPLVSLGELYMRLGRSNEAFESLDRAVRTDPSSVAALATRALYERDYLQAREAALDLDRALNLHAKNFYDLSALSRALYQRGGPGDTTCGIAVLNDALGSAEFDRKNMLDTYVRYGVWLAHAKRSDEAIDVFSSALKINPYHVKANYSIGINLRNKGAALLPEATAYFRRAVFAPAFTDEDFLDQANAANELRNAAQNPADRVDAERTALQLYARAIAANPNAVYARWDRGQLYDRLGKYNLAQRDFYQAATLHWFDATLLSTYAGFLRRHGQMAKAAQYEAKTRAVIAARIPPDDAREWSSSDCRYHDMDFAT